MKLDDRPVIDQLTEPTPLNILEEVRDSLHAWLLNSEDSLTEAEFLAAEKMLTTFADELEARL